MTVEMLFWCLVDHVKVHWVLRVCSSEVRLEFRRLFESDSVDGKKSGGW